MQIKSSKKSSTKRKLISECDQLVRKLVLNRDDYKCVRCGGNHVLQASHVISKGRATRIRFELLNVLTMCLKCHIFWAHRDPVGFVDWVNKTYPGRIEQLQIMAATAGKLDLKELVIALRREVESLDPPSKAVIPDLNCATNLPF